MSFWDRFYRLCIENNTKPSPVVKELGIAAGAVTKWKNGTLPTLETAILIANHFNVSVGYLIGESEFPQNTDQNIEKLAIRASEDDWIQVLSQMSDDSLIQLRDYTRYLLWKQAQAHTDLK
ncbi:MAG: helix-turn-helix domain-containing protein [Oscillospiraceae bacterium]|nr:helix-turn-helix domain-containing protein [Oscillospiraceae bacterium]